MTCVAKVVEVGVDANGKVLKSLVMVPGEIAGDRLGRKRWTKSSSCSARPWTRP